jgi:hypothetical protein
VAYAAVVPGYSGGTATELHRLPYSFRQQQAAGTPWRQGGRLAQPLQPSSKRPQLPGKCLIHGQKQATNEKEKE